MKMKYACLPCLVNQAVRVAEITKAENREALFKKVFAYLATVDFTASNPEIIGSTFRLLKEHIHNEDPYKEIRAHYNSLFLNKLDFFESQINQSNNPMELALKYAIVGNSIDFNPIHNSSMEEILGWFANVNALSLEIDHTDKLMCDLVTAKTLLYLGDNCGELCLDKLFIGKIKALYPSLEIYFGVRGAPVINDSIKEDALLVGMEDYAHVVSNGDDAMGTVLPRTSQEFRQIYHGADVIIAKGQANYESLSEQVEKNVYFLLMAKCDVIAGDIGVPQKSIVCMNSKRQAAKE